MDPARVRNIVTLGALLLALIHVLFPALAIDAVTLVLMVIAIVPWLAPLFKSLELPGGWKIEFQELQKLAAKADTAGLLSRTEAAPHTEYAFQCRGSTRSKSCAGGSPHRVRKALGSTRREAWNWDDDAGLGSPASRALFEGCSHR